MENEQIKVTVYVRDDGAVLVAIGSWYPADRKCVISVNREALGLTGEYEFYAPAMEGFQEEAVFAAQELVPIKAGRGWMFLIREKTGN